MMEKKANCLVPLLLKFFLYKVLVEYFMKASPTFTAKSPIHLRGKKGKEKPNTNIGYCSSSLHAVASFKWKKDSSISQ